MNLFENILIHHPDFINAENLIFSENKSVQITGLLDIHKAHFLHSFSAIEKSSSIFLLLAPDESSAQKMCADLNFMGTGALFYPSRDFNFYDIEGSSKEYEHTRLNVLNNILNKKIKIVISCIDAALQYTIPQSKLSSLTKKICINDVISQKELIGLLLNSGYSRFDQVEGPGQFSVRGGIIDVFSPSSNLPCRIEFWGDNIDSVSQFDILTQRKINSVNEINIIPASEVVCDNFGELSTKIYSFVENNKNNLPQKGTEILLAEANKLESNFHISSLDKFINFIYSTPNTLLDYLDVNSKIFISEQAKILDRIKSIDFQSGEDLSSYLEDGILTPGLGKFSEDKNYFTASISGRTTVFMDTFLQNKSLFEASNIISVNARQLPVWNGSFNVLCDDINSLKENSKLVVFAGTNRSATSLFDDLNKNGYGTELLNRGTLSGNCNIFIAEGSLSSGFEYPELGISVMTYGHYNKQKSSLHKSKKSKRLFNLKELNIGDYVVHSLHGIGVFKGIHKLNMDGVQKDYIKINYAKDDTLYVPVTQLDLVDKYIGSKDSVRVRLNRLGTDSWQKTKSRVRSITKDIAKELIKIYAKRINAPGHAFFADSEVQHDFESHFEYEETADQLRCIDEIKSDMEKRSPMDRLLCGDVGVGKTEVALRAACKCVCNSKQCAILVPTTILAWQHFQTALKRFESIPVRIEVLSRFRTAKQQADILNRLKRGEIDIIIGTHKLLQKSIEFYDLGLVIIDEEQRFGVAQKERFKEISKNVDILTLTATPIPRTLNMAMSGLRDISSIEESPQNRFPVQTYVLEHSPAILTEAIRKELRRGGQIYYLYNSVEKISEKALVLQNQVPEAKIGYAHGKMSEQELSLVWQKVINQEIDILVCTTIIETGIDIPNVNTLIIENADHMGLSQLHQLRGRVGRSSRRAYAYFTFKKNKILTEISQKRLSTIREFTEFGAGFKIAMRDLEIRGAGNILGGEQHGHLADIGYDMYIKMLNDAVAEEKGEKCENSEIDCLIDIHVSAHIPEDYISNLNNRIDIYRRISDIRTKEDSFDVIDELIDRFGDPPDSVRGLVDIALIRNISAKVGIYEIKQRKNTVLLYKNEINRDFVSKLIKNLKNQVLLSSGTKPYISVSLENSHSVLDTLKNIMSVIGTETT